MYRWLIALLSVLSPIGISFAQSEKEERQDAIDHAQELVCGKALERTGGLTIERTIHDGHGKLLGYYNREREGKYVHRTEVAIKVQPNGLISGGFISDCKVTGSMDLRRRGNLWLGKIEMSKCRAPWMDGGYIVKVRSACDSFEWEWEKKEPHRIVGKMVTYPPRWSLLQ